MHIKAIGYYLLFAACMALVLVSTACAGEITEAVAVDDMEAGVSAEGDTETATGEERPAGWGEASHSNDAEPNYEVVFPDDQVNQITITIAPEDWEAMQANMTELFDEAGAGGAGRGFPGGDFERQPGQFSQPGQGDFPEGTEPPEGDPPQPGEEGFPEGFEPPQDGQRPAMSDGLAPGGRPGGGQPGAGDMTPVNPEWVEATVEFQGSTWSHVGVRYKGNSSLTSGWRSGEQ